MNIFGQDFLIGSNLLLLLLIGELFNISSGSVGIILNMCGFDTITRNVNVLCSTIVVFFYILLIPFMVNWCGNWEINVCSALKRN